MLGSSRVVVPAEAAEASERQERTVNAFHARRCLLAFTKESSLDRRLCGASSAFGLRRFACRSWEWLPAGAAESAYVAGAEQRVQAVTVGVDHLDPVGVAGEDDLLSVG